MSDLIISGSSASDDLIISGSSASDDVISVIVDGDIVLARDAARLSADEASQHAQDALASSVSSEASNVNSTAKSIISTEQATISSSSAAIATTKASEASSSASSALSSLNDSVSARDLSQTYMENAETYSNNSSASAVASSASSAEAAISATAALVSETNSATSETNSALSESNASDSEIAAAASESASAAAVTAAELSATNSASSATSSSNSAIEASGYATNSANSATDSANSASAASNSATNAASSASSASSSATTATTKASEALTSANNAATSEASAAASLDSFTSMYKGALAVAPTLDLFEGNLYFNSTDGILYIYTNGTWQETTNFLKGFIGTFKFIATSGQTIFTGADANGDTLLMYAGFATNVFLNGMLLDKTDYTLSNNDTVTLALGTNALDEVVVHGYQAMTLVEAQQAQLARDAAQAAQLASEGARDTALSHKNDAATSASAALASENAAATSETNVSNDETIVTAAKNSIDARYLVSATEPASPVEGTMWFDTVNNSMKVFDGTVFTETVSNISGVENSTEYTATAGQTTFAADYNVGFVKVFLNGIMLKDADFTATNGTSIVLLAGAALDDTVYIQSFGTFELADAYTKVASDSRFEPIDASIVKDADIGVTVLSPTGDGSGLTGILPSQTGKAQQVLTTDGTTASWLDNHEATQIYGTVLTANTINTAGVINVTITLSQSINNFRGILVSWGEYGYTEYYPVSALNNTIKKYSNSVTADGTRMMLAGYDTHHIYMTRLSDTSFYITGGVGKGIHQIWGIK